jgi:hypothetical protein
MSFQIHKTEYVRFADVSEKVITSSGNGGNGSYTPTIDLESSGSGGNIDTINLSNYVENGNFVTINGNFVMTYPTGVQKFTIFISPPANFPIVENLTDPPSGSVLLVGGNGNNSSPFCQSISWVSRSSTEISHPNTFQILVETGLNTQSGQDLNSLNYTITYKK